MKELEKFCNGLKSFINLNSFLVRNLGLNLLSVLFFFIGWSKSLCGVFQFRNG